MFYGYDPQPPIVSNPTAVVPHGCTQGMGHSGKNFSCAAGGTQSRSWAKNWAIHRARPSCPPFSGWACRILRPGARKNRVVPAGPRAPAPKENKNARSSGAPGQCLLLPARPERPPQRQRGCARYCLARQIRTQASRRGAAPRAMVAVRRSLIFYPVQGAAFENSASTQPFQGISQASMTRNSTCGSRKPGPERSCRARYQCPPHARLWRSRAGQRARAAAHVNGKAQTVGQQTQQAFSVGRHKIMALVIKPGIPIHESASPICEKAQAPPVVNVRLQRVNAAAFICSSACAGRRPAQAEFSFLPHFGLSYWLQYWLGSGRAFSSRGCQYTQVLRLLPAR